MPRLDPVLFRVLRSCALVCAVVAPLLVVPGYAVHAANIDADLAARQKINIAGRQRMLSQRLAAATCLVMAGVDAEARRTIAQQAWQDFDTALRGLAEGNDALRLPAEHHDDILGALAQVGDIWRHIGPSMTQVMEGDVQTVTISAVLSKNIPLLKASNAAVQRFVERYSAGVIDPATATTIDVAGRQRMLSQKMMKEACFVAVDLNATQMGAALLQTVSQFDNALLQLQNGAPEAAIISPPNDQIAAQLDTVAGLWRGYRNDLLMVLQQPDAMDLLETLSHQSDDILAAMHKAVQMYVD